MSLGACAVPDAHHRRCAPRSGRSLGSREAAYAALSLQRARVGRRRFAKVFGACHAFRLANDLGALSGTKDGVTQPRRCRSSMGKENAGRSLSRHLRCVPCAKYPHCSACARDGLASFAPAPFADASASQTARNALAHSDGRKLARPSKTNRALQKCRWPRGFARPGCSAIAVAPASFPSLRRLR
jgi:hypothetical protein